MPLTRRDLVAGAAASLWAGLDAQAATRRWVDVHMHVIGGRERQFGQAVERAVAAMDEFGIAKSVVFPPPLSRPSFDFTDYVPELKRYPGRFGFLGGGGLLNSSLHRFGDPDSVTPDVRQQFEDVAQRMADAGAAGFGEIALLHLSLTRNHPFEQASPEHPLMLTLMKVAGRAGLAIDLHMDAVMAAESRRSPAGLKIPPNPERLNGNIAAFERMLAFDRGARVVWAHGGSDFLGDMTPALIGRLMDAHPNLCMSLRPLTAGRNVAALVGLRVHNTIMTEQGLVPAWLNLFKRHSDRFVFGADAFFLASSVPADSAVATLGTANLRRLRAVTQLLSRLPPDLARQFGEVNAARFYRL